MTDAPPSEGSHSAASTGRGLHGAKFSSPGSFTVSESVQGSGQDVLLPAPSLVCVMLLPHGRP